MLCVCAPVSSCQWPRTLNREIGVACGGETERGEDGLVRDSCERLDPVFLISRWVTGSISGSVTVWPTVERPELPTCACKTSPCRKNTGRRSPGPCSAIVNSIRWQWSCSTRVGATWCDASRCHDSPVCFFMSMGFTSDKGVGDGWPGKQVRCFWPCHSEWSLTRPPCCRPRFAEHVSSIPCRGDRSPGRQNRAALPRRQPPASRPRAGQC